MFTLYEQSQEHSELDRRSKSLSRQISLALVPVRLGLKLRAGDPIDLDGSQISVIREGLCRISHQDKPLAFFDSGDLVGWPRQLPPGTKVVVETDASVDQYNADSLGASIEAGASLSVVWTQYLDVQRQLIWDIVNQFAIAGPSHSLRLRSVAPGQAIVIQDTPQGSAYLLICGEADVFVGETKVGEVLSGEIFGALNQVGESVRVASVVARSDSIVAEFEQEEFRQYVMRYPHFAHKMFATMSRVITSQNQKIVNMTN